MILTCQCDTIGKGGGRGTLYRPRANPKQRPRESIRQGREGRTTMG